MAFVPSSPVIRQADLRQTCEVCMESLYPPVFQCHNGHLFCEGCISKLKTCAVCRANLPQVRVRCLAMEKIIRMLQHPCPNETDGCQAKRLKYDQLEAHRIECDYKKFPICELLFGHRGCEEVRSCDYEEHYERKHGTKLVDYTEPPTLPATQIFEASIVNFDELGVEVDAANKVLKCKPWVLARRAVGNQLNCEISFVLSGEDVPVSIISSVFNLETKKEELRACRAIPWPYSQSNVPPSSSQQREDPSYNSPLEKNWNSSQ